MLKTKEASTTPHPIMLIRDFDSAFLPSPLIKKPSKGRKGISQTISKAFFISLKSELSGQNQVSL